MARFFPPIMSSKQKTKIIGEPIKIYFEPSRFNTWDEVKHVQLNLYDVETNTNLLESSASLYQGRNSDGELLFIQVDGTVGTAITANPYLINSTALSILFFSKDEILFDEEGGHVIIPQEYCPQNKLLKTQVRLGRNLIPDKITPSWISNELAHGDLSEWSSPSVFRIISQPSLVWINQEDAETIAIPTFYISTSSDESIHLISASLNGEVIEYRMSGWSITKDFEFKTQSNIGTNLLLISIRTEGGYELTREYKYEYSGSLREPLYYVYDCSTTTGGIELKIVDEDRYNVFEYKPPKAPPGMRYSDIDGAFYFSGSSDTLNFMNNKKDNINQQYNYVIGLTANSEEPGQIILTYDYVNGNTETHYLGSLYSGQMVALSNIPHPSEISGVKYSYLSVKYSDNSIRIDADSIRISRSRLLPVQSYLIKRASASTGYARWDTIIEYRPEMNSGGQWSYVDNTAESGMVYKYAIIGRDLDGSLSAPGKEIVCMSSAESMWVSTKNIKFLDFVYDLSISGMRIAKKEQVVETLGSAYPYVVQSGKTSYKTFSISCTFFSEMDVNKESTLGIYDRGGNSATIDEQIIEADLISNLEMSWEKNYIKEREIRNVIIRELSSVDPILIKIDGQKNMIAKMTNISFNPRKELGNVIYSLSAQVVEIDDATIENLKKYKLINEKVVEINE